ncbi:MAG: hypothetical protein J07HR59_00427 [Halorubrum sp. J07HR59]|nr:MAG: hypothetical protein J07HR59_00427 [Halorubrum sp. J07HR59]
MRIAALAVFILVVGGLSLATGPAVSGLGESPVAAPDGSPVVGAEPLSLDEASVGATREPDSADPTALQGSLETTPDIEFLIGLTPTGDARWTVTTRYELSDDREAEAFQVVGNEFENGEVGPDPAVFSGYAESAAAVTGRAMEIQSVERVAEVSDQSVSGQPGRIGELRLSFTWTMFLESDGEDLVLGDVFLLSEQGESWLGRLGDNQRLTIQTPDGYRVDSTPAFTPRLLENNLVIDGPKTFDSDNRIRVIYSPIAGQTGPLADLTPSAVVIGVLLVGGILTAGGLLYRRRGDDDDLSGGPASDGSSGPGDDPPASPEPEDPDPEPDPEAAAPTDGTPATEETAEDDLSLLSDEERVERLLEQNGGRMRQADIVSDTGWSDAKVSQLLSKMAQDDRVEKLRLGRENLISLPGHQGFDDTDPLDR